MSRSVTSVFLLILSLNLHAQRIFSVDYVNQADLKVFKVDYYNQATGNEGLWYFTDYVNQAQKKIFFVKHVNQADLKIFFVPYTNQAGWVNASKKHLLY